MRPRRFSKREHMDCFIAMASETAIAWAAGLFEGEGSIQFPASQAPRLSLCSTDRDVVEKFHAIVGVGRLRKEGSSKILPDGTRRVYKDAFRWRCDKIADVKRVMELLLPHLGERRSARWREVQLLHTASWPARVCPQCGSEFAPIRRAQITCGHDCSWRYSKRVGKYGSRRSREPILADL